MQVPSQSTHKDSLRLSTNVTETESMSQVNNEVITDTADDQNEDEKDILIDELLCFVSNKIDILPPTTIKQLCVSTFTEDDIEKSKNLLYDICETTDRKIKRKGPEKSNSNLDDIIKFLMEHEDELPKFAALDLTKLPPITYNSIDVSVLLNDITKVQAEVNQLKECLKIQTNTSDSLKKTTEMIITRLESNEKQQATTKEIPKRHARTPKNYEKNPKTKVEKQKVTKPRMTMETKSDGSIVDTFGNISDTDVIIESVQELSNKKVTSTINRNEQENNEQNSDTVENTDEIPKRQSYAKIAEQRSPVNSSEQLDDIAREENNKAWQLVTRKKSSGNKINGPKQQQPTNNNVIGKAKNSGLKTLNIASRQRIANVFVTRFDPSVTEEDIKEYLTKTLNLDVQVEKVQTRFNTYASFHIVCQCAQPEIFMSSDLWPENTLVRWWRQPRNINGAN